MKILRCAVQTAAVWSCLLPVIRPLHAGAPPGATAERPRSEPASATQRAIEHDVFLHERGLLVGQVISSDGSPIPQRDVSLLHRGSHLATARSDAEGRFAFQGLRGGVFEIATLSERREVRVWTVGSSPPEAVAGVLLVEGAVVRGQAPSLAPPEPVGSLAETTLAPSVSDFTGEPLGEGVPQSAPLPEGYATQGNANGPYVVQGEAMQPYGTGPSYYGDPGYNGAQGSYGGGRGLFGTGAGIFSRPLLLGAGVAAAIAIPVALDNDDAS